MLVNMGWINGLHSPQNGWIIRLAVVLTRWMKAEVCICARLSIYLYMCVRVMETGSSSVKLTAAELLSAELIRDGGKEEHHERQIMLQLQGWSAGKTFCFLCWHRSPPMPLFCHQDSRTGQNVRAENTLWFYPAVDFPVHCWNPWWAVNVLCSRTFCF